MEADDSCPDATTIAIIGGGFSGTMLAVQLMRQCTPAALTIVMIERTPRLARGVAYNTRCPRHLLNVPASKMSAFPDGPDHFLAWARRRIPDLPAQAFVARALYADYLEHVLVEAHAQRPAGLRFVRLWDEAMAAERDPSAAGLTVRLRSGRCVHAKRAVLALGNLAPADPPIRDPTFYDSPRYIKDPWSSGRLTALEPDDDVLIIGTGLTMIDQLVQLDAAGHRGTIHALSRHGLLPLPHRATAVPTTVVAPVLPDHLSMRSLLRAVRVAVATTTAAGGDWRSVMDTLRPITQEVWQGLPLEERRRFLRHVRPYWDVHRHRVAPAMAAKIDVLRQDGRLRFHAGRIVSLRQTGARIEAVYSPRRGEGTQTLRVAWVINCTGPSSNLCQSKEPLIASLCAGGLLRPDPLGLGAEVGPGGSLLDRTGRQSDSLYTLGPLRKGHLWETTAVPELRAQAAQLADILTRSIVPTGQAVATA